MSICDEIRPHIAAWIDGELDARYAVEVEAHVTECVDCARVAAEFRAIKTASSAAFDIDAEALWGGVEAQIDQPDLNADLLLELRSMRAEINALHLEVAELRRELSKRLPMPTVRTSPFSFPDAPERALKQYRLV